MSANAQQGQWIDCQLGCRHNRWKKLMKSESHDSIKKAGHWAGKVMVNEKLGTSGSRASNHFQDFLSNGRLTRLVVIKSERLG